MSEDTVIYQGITRQQTKCYISLFSLPLCPSPHCNTQQTKLTIQAILHYQGNTWLDSVEFVGL